MLAVAVEQIVVVPNGCVRLLLERFILGPRNLRKFLFARAGAVGMVACDRVRL